MHQQTQIKKVRRAVVNILRRAVRLIPRQLWVVVTLAFVIGSVGQTSLAQAAPPSQAGREHYVYLLTSSAAGHPNRICVGDLVVITVKAERQIANYGSSPPIGPGGEQFSSPIQQVAGVRIDGLVGNPDYGTLTPTRQLTSMRSDPPGSAVFKFAAKSPGTTEITFTGVVVNTFTPDTNYLPPPPLEVKVINCMFKVEAIGQWYEASDGASYSIVAVADEAMVTADADGHYTGSASVNWVGTGSGDCVFPVQISSGQIHYTGEINESGQLVMNQTYEPVENSWNYVCGNHSGWGKGLFTSDSISVSISSSGGVATMPHVLNVIWWIPMSGSVTTVIKPEEEEAVAFNPGSHETSWNDILTLLGFSLVLH